MSTDWARDIDDMHARFNVHEWVEDNPELLQKFLKFRMAFLDEELNETKLAVENNDPEEIVDGLIDLCVVAIGTLNAFGVDAHKAWDEVHRANMNKEKGVKESRPNKLGLPDLVKMPDWVPPDHSDNHGLLTDVLK